jgi:hypothetical protein
MRDCRACGRPIAHRLVFVTMEFPGQEPEEVGPYGRDCARKVVDGAAALGVGTKRRRAYEP